MPMSSLATSPDEFQRLEPSHAEKTGERKQFKFESRKKRGLNTDQKTFPQSPILNPGFICVVSVEKNAVLALSQVESTPADLQYFFSPQSA